MISSDERVSLAILITPFFKRNIIVIFLYLYISKHDINNY